MNKPLASHVLDTIYQSGVREICLCAGARSSPLVSLLSTDTRFRTFRFFEERSASFFGSGRIKATSRPVAIVTTSGTAAGELLPATMESYYSSLPLVLVTADRPRRFRGTGAPQTAEQVGLFGIYAEIDIDIAEAERLDISEWTVSRPLHINVCFDEPLLGADGEFESLPTIAASLSRQSEEAISQSLTEARLQLSEFLKSSKSPIVIVGGLAPEERQPTLEFLIALGAPVLLESLSGLRENPALEPLALHSGKDALVRKSASGDSTVWMDGVLRIGSVPTLRLWRDLESSLQHLPLLSLSSQPFSGASRGTLVHAPLAPLLGTLAQETSSVHQTDRHSTLIVRDRALSAALLNLLKFENRSEPGLIHRFSEALPIGSRLFLGNSLPIREWDLAATRSPRDFEIGASRGLNGIDGQLSTFLGFSREEKENWGLFGDLTAMYDMSAPWILRQLPLVRAHIVVINNGGGKIFDRMFQDPAFQNPHDLTFEHLAQFWDLDYVRWEAIPAVLPTSSLSRGRSFVEIVPDDAATHRFWQAYDGLAASFEAAK
ncbi:MAG: 2-succinyl-5-enolpyruvyl-6-hydroxy-3-cyclohexene-1-carboxylic-acid synthase [Janthinobacterium lividum]